MQEEKRGEAGKDRFECEEYCCVSGREMLLGPALNRKCSGSGQQAGDGQGDEKTGCKGQVWFSSKREGDRHEDGGNADLEGSELSGRNSVRGVS